MRHLIDYINESISQKDVDRVWNSICTPKLKQFITRKWNKENSDFKDFFDIIYLYTIAAGVSCHAEMIVFYLLELYKKNNIPSKIVYNIGQHFEKWLKETDFEFNSNVKIDDVLKEL
jgi:glucosamine 6-phosphate synthetase-like amidotransferase/phosphosugar isomerase protein